MDGLPHLFKRRGFQKKKVTDILLKYGELISPIVIKPEESKRRKDSFIKTVMSEGKPLYSSISTP
ncbi:hypothetical protein [Thermococcus sp.]